MEAWNVGILPQQYTVSQPEDGGSMDLWNVGILPQHYTALKPETWGLKRWYPTTTQHNTALKPEDGGLKRWYPTTTLHGVTTHKTSTWNITAVKISDLEAHMNTK
jgi:hypothetical protein